MLNILAVAYKFKRGTQNHVIHRKSIHEDRWGQLIAINLNNCE